MARKPADLEDNPQFYAPAKEPLPVTRTTEYLCTTDGDLLEVMTRVTSPTMADALQISHIMSKGRGSRYVAGRCDQIMRVAVSRDGMGRRDLVDALEAAGKTPDAYYMTGPKSEFRTYDD